MKLRALLAIQCVFGFFTIGLTISLCGTASASCIELSDAELIESLPDQIESRRQSYFAEENGHFSDPSVEGTAKFLVDTRGWFGEKATSSPLRFLLSMSEFKLLAKNPAACEALAAKIKANRELYMELGAFGDRDFLDASKMHMTSAILVEYDLIRQLPGSGSYDSSTFHELAARIGLKPTLIQEGFRIDSRPPNEIMNEGAFRPNPGKPRGSMTEHSLPNKALVFSSQGSNFVSTSIKEGNEFNLKIYPIFSSARTPTTPKLPQFQIAPSSKILETWEYRITGYEAVVPHASSRIEGEAEVVTNEIPASKITHARRIILHVKLNDEGKPSNLIHSDIGTWQPISDFIAKNEKTF